MIVPAGLRDVPEAVREAVERDVALLGTGFVIKREDGTYERLDPTQVTMVVRDEHKRPATMDWVVDLGEMS